MPFARRVSDGVPVSPDEVSRGNKCGCISLCCGLPVIARQGEQLAWHFAHERASACEDGYDIAVRAMAIHLLKQSRTLLLPQYVIEVSGVSARGNRIVQRDVLLTQRPFEVDGFREEESIDGKACPHLVGFRRDREVLIDITGLKTRVGERTRLLRSTGKPVLEFDCRTLGPEIPSKESLNQALFESYSGKRWIFHPKEIAKRQELQRKLDVQLSVLAAQFERERRTYVPWTWEGLSAPRLPSTQPETRVPESLVSARSGWRASLPSRERVQRAIEAFSDRHALSLEHVMPVLGSVSSRGQLSGYTVFELAEVWATKIGGVSADDVLKHLLEAGYLLGASEPKD